MTEINGTCEERFSGVREGFAANFDEGHDVGASVAVFIDGEPVVDLWGGWADEARTTPWQRDTIVNVWSTTKTMTFVAVLTLVERGLLDLDAPVARYWPAFAANGKEGVLVRHVMAHTAGLSGWEEPMPPEGLYDWDKATSMLAAQAPWWEPGTASGYHAITQGYLLGELVRQVTGQSFGTFFRTEIAEPLGADFHVGLDPAHDDRVALVIPPPRPERPEVFPPMMIKTLTNPPLDARQCWQPEWRRAEIPAAGGTGNARSVAAVQSVLSCGGEARVRLFSRDDRPAGARGAGAGRGSGAGRHVALRHRVRPELGGAADGAGREHRLLGRVRRVADRQRSRPAAHVRLRDEQHAAWYGRRRAELPHARRPLHRARWLTVSLRLEGGRRPPVGHVCALRARHVRNGCPSSTVTWANATRSEPRQRCACRFCTNIGQDPREQTPASTVPAC
ncbi:MAG: serine hydrolase domain-containing protein [Acidimicrobiales bacterium]